MQFLGTFTSILNVMLCYTFSTREKYTLHLSDSFSHYVLFRFGFFTVKHMRHYSAIKLTSSVESIYILHIDKSQHTVITESIINNMIL